MAQAGTLDDLFSKDTASFFRSPVRDIFKRVDLNAIYSFAGGYPSADTFPLDDFREIMDHVISTVGAKAFQYGATQGVTELREALAARYNEPIERIQITSSSQQGIDVSTRILADPGDVILTSSPSYLGALQSFRSYRADVIGVRYNPDPDAFYKAYDEAASKALQNGKRLKFIYAISDFQNPSGETLPLEHRRRLVEIASKYDMVIVEDAPYRELRYEGEPVPTIYSLDRDRVLHLGSFSKVMAPGFRLGWIFGNPDLLDKIYVCKQSLDLCPPVFDQYVAAEFLASGRLDRNLSKSIALYRSKRDLMLRTLEESMPQGVTWTHPEGGLFLFLTLPPHFDTVRFYDTALSAGVAYVSGKFFNPEGIAAGNVTDISKSVEENVATGANTMRLNFSFMTPERIEAGMRLLADLLKLNL
ncbi:MAG: PLP-dependent aminotransferase family protein [Bacteroidales bacterium]|nr:PLP-dependent aminotransferase family protein [Bacteroidales bacterium]